MPTIFVGGSRQVDHLPDAFGHRLRNIVAGGHRVVVGDAPGADTAIQRRLHEQAHGEVTVYCSGAVPRNNHGRWPTRRARVPEGARGFAFHAVKDRHMAEVAEFGLMLWDGTSPGTVLNALRLVDGGKACVMFDLSRQEIVTIRSIGRWRQLVSRCGRHVRDSLRHRATPAEWAAAVGGAEPALAPDRSSRSGGRGRRCAA
ncbi:hypothetical protein Q8W71_32290 [Methylobacterium sp. NEAU 140]|nr:hypothetical protein [Methylobacterium sp. NEAU 140]